MTTARTFDAATGRATGIDTAKETAAYQAETYGWRSDGLLGRRAKGADREDFAYDLLGRLTGAEAYLDGSRTAGRTLAYGYDALGNLTSKTSDVAGDADAATYAYGTGSTAPTRLASAVLGGRATTFGYDADGHVERHDAATGEDAFIEWNGRGLPSRITVGATAADAAPKARDEFRYGPAGERHHRRITWREELADGTTRMRTAEAYRVGAHAAHARVEKTHVGPALEVRTSATSSAPVFEYVHADHLGSAAAVAALAAGQDAGRARSGFTGHEPLDRTGFVHMNGRLYDPQVGRFLSPDPVVSEPWSGQGWNPYSYVQNSPLSFTDPTGYIMEGGCIVDPSGGGAAAGALGGFTSVAATLWTRGLSFRIPIYFTVQWRSVSFSVGGSLGVDGWGDDRSYAGVSYRPWVTVGFGPVTPVWTLSRVTVSTGNQESDPPDSPMSWLLDTYRAWWLERLRKHHEKMRSDCVQKHGPEGCNETTVKDLASVFGDATAILGGAATAAPIVRTAAGIPRIFRASTAEVRVVMGRTRDLQNLPSNERSLLGRLPNRYNNKMNWRQNSSVLRQEMRRNRPIRDASPGDDKGVFLNAERNLLRHHGWEFDERTNLWMPPGS